MYHFLLLLGVLHRPSPSALHTYSGQGLHGRESKIAIFCMVVSLLVNEQTKGLCPTYSAGYIFGMSSLGPFHQGERSFSAFLDAPFWWALSLTVFVCNESCLLAA